MGREMALFYNIHLLEQFSKGNPATIMELLTDWHNKKTIAKNSKDKFVPRNYSGSNFLLNPSDFLNDKRTDIYFRLQYLRLSSLRNYADYKLFGQTWLDTTLYPDLNRQAIQQNPLLTINNTKIHFKYEG